MIVTSMQFSLAMSMKNYGLYNQSAQEAIFKVEAMDFDL